MRHTVRLKLDCARGVLAFCRRYPGSAPATLEAEDRLERLMAQATILRDQERFAQEEEETAARMRDQLARSLKERLDVLLRLAAAVALGQGIGELRIRVRLRLTGPGIFLRAARQVIDTANAHQSLLVRYGMPGGMLNTLSAELDSLQAAHNRRVTSTAVHAAAAADLATLAAEAMLIIRHLDALNRIRFAAAPDRLAEWLAVSTVRWGRVGDRADRSDRADAADRASVA
jgi:hypothetical protein